MKDIQRSPSFCLNKAVFPHHHLSRMVYSCQWEKKRINLKTQAPVLQRNISPLCPLYHQHATMQALNFWYCGKQLALEKYWHFAALLRPSPLPSSQLLNFEKSTVFLSCWEVNSWTKNIMAGGRSWNERIISRSHWYSSSCCRMWLIEKIFRLRIAHQELWLDCGDFWDA